MVRWKQGWEVLSERKMHWLQSFLWNSLGSIPCVMVSRWEWWHQGQKMALLCGKLLGIILSVGNRTIRGRQPSVWKANWKRLFFSSQPLSPSDNVTQNKKWDEAAFAILEMFSKWIGSLTKADHDVDGIVELLKCHVSFATVLSPLPDRLKPIKLKTGTIDHLEWTTLEHADCCWEYECILKQVGSNIVRFPS